MRTKKDLEKIKTILEERRDELEDELSRLYAERSSDGQVQDTGDQALSASFESIKETVQDNEFEEYNMIKQALESIEKGDYGVCIDCHQEIKEKRLMWYPNATRCVVCQEAVEG